MKNENLFSINYKALAENILKLREKHGFTQDDLAGKINVDNHTISNWENERTKISRLKDIDNLCRVFECDIIHLLGIDKYKDQKGRIAGKYLNLSAPAIDSIHGNEDFAKHLNYLLTYHNDDIKSIIDELYFACQETALLKTSTDAVKAYNKKEEIIKKQFKNGKDVTKQLNEMNPKEIDNYIDIMDKSEREILKSRLKLPRLTDNLIDNTNTEYFLNN